MRNFIGDFLGKRLDNYLHRNPETADHSRKELNRMKEAQDNGRN